MLVLENKITKFVNRIEGPFVTFKVLYVYVIDDVRTCVLLRFEVVEHVVVCISFTTKAPVFWV